MGQKNKNGFDKWFEEWWGDKQEAKEFLENFRLIKAVASAAWNAAIQSVINKYNKRKEKE